MFRDCYHRAVYIPRHFRQDEPATLRNFMVRHSFAILSIAAASRPEAVHLPLLWRPRDCEDRQCELGVLVGHVARANPIWQAMDGQREALVIFSGPHAYVSARWYISRPQVPTWNYQAVHAYGVPRLLEGEKSAVDMLQELAAKYEGALTDVDEKHKPWTMADEPEYSAALLGGIVAFEMPISELQGKFKLSQNKLKEDRAGVIEGLALQDDAASRDVAALMQDYIDQR